VSLYVASFVLGVVIGAGILALILDHFGGKMIERMRDE
jgi:predicted MFS family arabinose efflux permease